MGLGSKIAGARLLGSRSSAKRDPERVHKGTTVSVCPLGSGFKALDLGSTVWGFRVWGLGFWVLGFRVWVSGFRVLGLGFWVVILGFRILGLGLRVQGFGAIC